MNYSEYHENTGMQDYRDDLTAEAEELECLDSYTGEDCEGPVEYRPAMSPTGKWFPRCEAHLAKRLKAQERIVRDYGGQMYYD